MNIEMLMILETDERKIITYKQYDGYKVGNDT